MEKEFIPWDESLALKEFGFDEVCLYQYYLSDNNKNMLEYYENGITNTELDDLTDKIDEENIEYGNELQGPSCTAVLYQQAFKWFDKNTDFRGFVVTTTDGSSFGWATIDLFTKKKTVCEIGYSSRQEAELECIRKLIEIGKEEL